MAVRTPPSARRIGSQTPSLFTSTKDSADEVSFEDDLDESPKETIVEEEDESLEADGGDISSWLDTISEIPYDKKDHQEQSFSRVIEDQEVVIEDPNEPKQVRKWVTVLLWVLAIIGFLSLALLLIYIKFVAGTQTLDGFLDSFKDWVDGILGR